MSRPYFETTVVKVKKEKKCNHLNAPCIHTYIYNGKIRCPQCGKILTSEWLEKRKILDPLLVKEDKEKGNWVNNENLDAIKFPCFCRFDYRKGIFGGKQGVHGIGIINRTAEAGEIQYQLSWADRQMENSGRLDISENLSVLCTAPSLKRLIELYDIHIKHGKIIIYEEE